MKALLSAFAVALACVLVGCAGSSASQGTEEPALSLEELGAPAVRTSIRETIMRDQEGVALCMKAAGFEYDDWVEPDYTPLPNSVWVRPEDGYGIAQTVQNIYESSLTDPNAARLLGLDDPQKLAYLQSLLGDEAADIVAAGLPLVQSPEGCVAQATKASGSESLFDALDSFNDAYRAANQEAASDSSVVAGISRWVTCMASVGYPYGSQREIVESLRSDLAASTGELLAAGEADQLNAEGGAFDQIAQREMAIAMADFGCYVDNLKNVYEPRLEALLRENLEGRELRPLLDLVGG